MSDPHDLHRFVDAQRNVYEQALSEIVAGSKRTHWMWFVFPQLLGLAKSAQSRRYAIRNAAEARAYLDHPILGPRLRECAEAAVRVEDRTAEEIFGTVDAMKLRSSATLFASVLPAGSVFDRVLAKFHGGVRDLQTLALLDAAPVAAPVLVFIVGPPAVGKMTVGHELAQRTGLRLFHNHHSIDLVLRFFDFGTPAYSRLVGEFRRRIFEEVAASDLPGLVFTYVWAFDDPRDAAGVEQNADIFRKRGSRVVFVELEAAQEERLRRNATEFRLAEKPFKRDLDHSRRMLLEHDAQYQLNSHGVHDGREDWFRLDTTELSAADVADRIIARFALARVPSVFP